MLVSIVMATRNHAPLLARTLDSIYWQQTPLEFEVVITDDGSTDSTATLLRNYRVRSFRLEKASYGNPARALNNSLREARGDILIMQSDDVIPVHPRAMAALALTLAPGEIGIASVQEWDTCEAFVTPLVHAGIHNKRPLFFLGACWRSDICKIGGYDADAFEGCLWWHDNWLADCLTEGLGLTVAYPPILALHQSHQHPAVNLPGGKAIYDAMRKRAVYHTPTAPWKYVQGVSVNGAM